VSIGQLLTLPLAAFALGVEALLKTMREVQEATRGGIDAAMSDATAADAVGGAESNPARKEWSEMRDQDLSGDDQLKLVRYKIIFTKRDFEAVFPEKEELVTYGTSAADWAGIKVAHFMRDLSTMKESDLPREWRESVGRQTGETYPPSRDGHYYIPRDDERYVKVYFEVLQRWDREPADYDKDQVKVLREIRDRIGPVPRA